MQAEGVDVQQLRGERFELGGRKSVSLHVIRLRCTNKQIVDPL